MLLRSELQLWRRPGCTWRSAAPPSIVISRLVSSLAARLQTLSLDLCLLCRRVHMELTTLTSVQERNQSVGPQHSSWRHWCKTCHA